MHFNGRLARAGREKPPLDPDEIAKVQMFEALEQRLAEQILLDEDLEVGRPVADRGERGLAHAPDRHQPTRRPHFFILFKSSAYFGKTGTFERPSVRFEAQLLQLPEIHNALRAVLIDRLLLFL